MQAANRLLKALKTGSGLTFGAWQMLPGSNQARTIARCGFDWVLVDTEHGNIDGMGAKAQPCCAEVAALMRAFVTLV